MASSRSLVWRTFQRGVYYGQHSSIAGPSRSKSSAVVPTAFSPKRNQLAYPSQTQQRRHYSLDEKATKKACSKCGTPLPLSELSCISCGTLQALPTSSDAYDLLGINIENVGANGWKVDLGQLKASWRKRVALSHPDRMGGKDNKEQKIAEQQSALINKAYETLREPLQRAHLLVSSS